MQDGSVVQVQRRPVTSEEAGWINDIVAANPAWADVRLGELFVTGECTCGCRSVVLDVPADRQNPRLAGHKDLVGEIDITIRYDGKEDLVSVLLHYADGYLSILEVIWYNFPEPVPRVWQELHRQLRAG